MLNTEENFEILEMIYRSYSSIIFKAKNNETKEKVIIKTLNRELFDSLSLAKLKNEYKLLKKLQGDHVVKAYEFMNAENRFSMVIEDFGGISLDRYLKTTQIEIRELLDIAVKITKCLAYLNKKQVIHKDINPSNIVYNPNNKVVKLIDFGIASEFSFETMQALNPHKLEGTLPYLSPEQTGRMNRPLDYRTDFYSLGVTFYEMACAKLLIGKIALLPAATRDLVTIAACIGNHFNIRELSALAGKDAGKIAEWLKPAIYEEMIYVSGKIEDAPSQLQFRFCHDKFQQAGYQILANENKKVIHRNIARYYQKLENREIIQ